MYHKMEESTVLGALTKSSFEISNKFQKRRLSGELGPLLKMGTNMNIFLQMFCLITHTSLIGSQFFEN